MAEGGVAPEGVRSWRKPSTWFRRPQAVPAAISAAPSSPEHQQPTIPKAYQHSIAVNITTVSEELKDYLPKMATEAYIPLINEINTLPNPEARKALTEAVNSGDINAIAVIAYRVWNGLDPGRRKIRDLKDIPFITTFAKIMQEEVIARTMAQDGSDRIDGVKRSWASGAFLSAVKTPNWVTGIKPDVSVLQQPVPAENDGVATANSADMALRGGKL